MMGGSNSGFFTKMGSAGRRMPHVMASGAWPPEVQRVQRDRFRNAGSLGGNRTDRPGPKVSGDREAGAVVCSLKTQLPTSPAQNIELPENFSGRAKVPALQNSSTSWRVSAREIAWRALLNSRHRAWRSRPGRRTASAIDHHQPLCAIVNAAPLRWGSEHAVNKLAGRCHRHRLRGRQADQSARSESRDQARAHQARVES